MLLSADERDQLRASSRQALISRPSWSTVVQLGWHAIHIPEEHGGAGGTLADLAVVLHEAGRALDPSPLLASAVLATGSLLAAPASQTTSSLLASLASGAQTASVALASRSGSYDGSQRTLLLEEGEFPRLRGVCGFVLDAEGADALVAAARTTGGQTAVVLVPTDAPGIRIRRTPTVDETRRLHEVDFDGTPVPPSGVLAGPGDVADALVDRLVALGVVAAACDAVGSAEFILESTVEYACARQQFGRPIGSFQAVKHRCADMAIAVESARAVVQRAAADLDDDIDPIETAGVVASYVGPACSDVAAAALLVHGGIGFTWEHDVHRHLKRVKLDEHLFGTPSWHRRRLFARLTPASAV